MKKLTIDQILKPNSKTILPVLNYVLIHNGHIYSPFNTANIVKLKPHFEANFAGAIILHKKLFSKLYPTIQKLKFFTETNQLQFQLQQEIEITYRNEFTDDLFTFFKPYLDFEAQKPENVKYINEFDIQKIRSAVKFVSNDNLRPALNHIEVSKTNITATDAHIMYYAQATPEFTPQDFKLYIPQSIGNLISSINPFVGIYKSLPKNDIFYALDFFEPNISIICKNSKDFEKYINWQDVIPSEDSHQNILTFNLLDFKSAIKQLIQFTDSATNQIIIDVKADSVNLLVKNDYDFDFNLQFSQTFYTLVTEKQTELKYGFNARKLLKSINGLPKESKTIKLYLGQPNRSLVINNSILLMPILIN